MKRSPIRRMSAKRAAESKAYTFARSQFLAEHPLCQVTLREAGIPEEVALNAWRHVINERGGVSPVGLRIFWDGKIVAISRSHQIHHRNKRNGTRLTDARWFLAVSLVKHDEIENNKTWARTRGYLLDISADPDGFTPAGVQALTTHELMLAKGQHADQPKFFPLPRPTNYGRGPTTH